MTHADRIKTELAAAGVTPYGLRKMSSRHLPEVIHKDEHIMAAVYGQSGSGSALIVATEKRVIYIDKKPFFSNVDELSFDIVSGVKIGTAGPFCALTLHTRLGDYELRFVNRACAKRFVSYIESRRIEQPTP